MHIVVTGAENSGTGLVAKLLRNVGCEVMHRAVPHVNKHRTDFEPLWDLVGPLDAAVMVVRHHPAHTRSQLERSGRESTAIDAFRHVSEFCYEQGLPLYVWTYEAIVHEWPRSFVVACEDLGLGAERTIYMLPDEPPRDENAKHYHLN